MNAPWPDRVEDALARLALALEGEPSAGYFTKHRARYASDLRALEGRREDAILEVGALPCHVSHCLRTLGLPQLGVDVAPARMADFIARHGLEVVACDVERDRLPFEDGRFSLVLMHEVFEHLRLDPIHALRELARVTRPGGQLRLTTPNLYSLKNLLNLARGRGLLDPYAEFSKLRSTGHMGHFREYAAYELERFLAPLGFRVDEVRHDHYGGGGRAASALMRAVPKLRPYLAITATRAR